MPYIAAPKTKVDLAGRLLARLLELLVPESGKALFLVEAEAYFDESGTHSGSPIMCVAGYLFSPEQCRRFDQEWAEVLEEFSLRYFRMSECAHGTGEFKGRREICDPVARRMIGIIKRRAERGIVTSISEKYFNEHVSDALQLTTGPAYSWCIRWALGLVRDWIDKYNFEGTISYFFESGHQHQSITNQILDRNFGHDSQAKKSFRYGSHSFAGKVPSEASEAVLRPLQAADLLAWQYRNQKIREASGKRHHRLDLSSLTELPHVMIDWTPDAIDDQLRRFDEEAARILGGAQ